MHKLLTTDCPQRSCWVSPVHCSCWALPVGSLLAPCWLPVGSLLAPCWPSHFIDEPSPFFLAGYSFFFWGPAPPPLPNLPLISGPPPPIISRPSTPSLLLFVLPVHSSTRLLVYSSTLLVHSSSVSSPFPSRLTVSHHHHPTSLSSFFSFFSFRSLIRYSIPVPVSLSYDWPAVPLLRLFCLANPLFCIFDQPFTHANAQNALLSATIRRVSLFAACMLHLTPTPHSSLLSAILSAPQSTCSISSISSISTFPASSASSLPTPAPYPFSTHQKRPPSLPPLFFSSLSHLTLSEQRH